MKWPLSPEMKRFAALFAVFASAGLVITWLLLPPPPPKADTRKPPSLRVAGQIVDASGDIVANALDLVRRYARGEIAIDLSDGTSLTIKRAALGVEIDRVRLAEFVRESQRLGSAIDRAHQASDHPDEPLDVPLPLRLDADAAIQKLLDLKARLDSPAIDAFVDLEAKQLRPEKVGHRLDVYGTVARIDAAFRRGEDKVPAAVEEIKPRLVQAALGNVKFDAVLGYFETRYSQSSKAKDRTYNLRQAASKLDGAVLLPGETFDFNGVVGPRDEAHGYRVATVIAQGELVDGLGGGTCQISGTLHGAAFFAGLDIVERYPHSRPSFYIKLGLDATVVYPTINFRFRNPFDFPIVLHQTVSGGVVRAEILGPLRRHTVTYFRRIDGVTPFDEIERETPKLPEGKKVLVQRGIPGFKTTSSRVVRDGAYAVREKWSDAYPPTMQIIEVGAGPRNMDAKKGDDNHPEYVVDEYLVVTQGPDTRTPGVKEPEPGGGTIESREPGRTGSYGWIEKEGFSKYHADDKGSDEDEAEAEGDKKPEKKDKPAADDNRKSGKKKKAKAKSGT